MVLATSNAKMDILLPLEATPETNPLRAFRFDILLPRVSRTSTAFSRPTVPAFPRKELFWLAFTGWASTGVDGLSSLEKDQGSSLCCVVVLPETPPSVFSLEDRPIRLKLFMDFIFPGTADGEFLSPTFAFLAFVPPGQIPPIFLL
uniref:Uncharacterized protein n=1 Tax=Rhizophora mucronata TaxID=61149 RepID=A0A2P2JPA5_RHIMU